MAAAHPLQGESSYRPNHNFFGRENKTMCLGFIDLAEGEKVKPGDAIRKVMTLVISLETKPEIYAGREWHIQEGYRLVGTGTVLKLLDD